METIGEKIFNLRKERGVSQEQLSFALNVSRQTISRWERDTVKPTVENLDSLSKFFEVNSDYFLSEQIAVQEEAEKQIAVAKEVKKAKFKSLKILIAVAVSVLLAVCAVACGIASYIAITPVKGQEVVTANRFNTVGIVFMVAGILCSAILITLSILFIKNRRKNKT